jgi:hypothetical protein
LKGSRVSGIQTHGNRSPTCTKIAWALKMKSKRLVGTAGRFSRRRFANVSSVAVSGRGRQRRPCLASEGGGAASASRLLAEISLAERERQSLQRMAGGPTGDAEPIAGAGQTVCGICWRPGASPASLHRTALDQPALWPELNQNTIAWAVRRGLRHASRSGGIGWPLAHQNPVLCTCCSVNLWPGGSAA